MTRHNRPLAICLLLALATPAWAEDVAATLQWAQSVTLSVPVSGVVESVAVAAGQTVDSGTLLVKLEDTVFSARLDAAKARFQWHSRQQAETQKELDHAQELYDGTMLSEHELEVARIASDRARAEYEQAKADMAQAEFDLRHSAVRAPFNAIVLNVVAVPGQTVINRLQAEPLVTVAQRDRMHAYAEVARTAAYSLKPGQAVNVLFSGKVIGGKVAQMVQIPISEGKYPLYVEFTPGNRKVLAGQKVTLQLP